MLTRRHFLSSTAALAAASAMPRSLSAAEPQIAVTTPLRTLDYSAVQLLPGPMQEQFLYQQKLLMSLDDDRLLKPFRERTGLRAPGDDMGGWYSNSPFFDTHGSFDGYVPGHTFGQYLSGLARGAAITGDARSKAKVASLVQGFAPTLQGKFYDGYLLPAYTFDKGFCGLCDAYGLAGVATAGPLLQTALDAALPHLPEKALSRPEMNARPHTSEAQTWDESYTLPENLFLAYRRTGRSIYREVAIRFLEDDLYFNPLAENIDVLPGEHAYSHVNALSSAMQAYLVLGSQKHLRAAQNAFRMLEAQSFATGGWGPGETLLRPNTDELGRSLLNQPASFETPCGAYGHFKIARYLLTVTGDSHYGDSIERVLYNTILGAKPTLPDGSTFYYSDFTLSGHKTYHRDKWPCCSGTFPQITADYGITSYLAGTPKTGNGLQADPRGLSVVLYVPTRVTWKPNGAPVTIEQQTAYPASPSTLLTVTSDRDSEFTLAVRIPAWAGPKTRLSVNGKPEGRDLQPATFHGIRRTWRSGDRIELEFDMPLRTEKLAIRSVRTPTIAPQSVAPLGAEQPSNPTVTIPPQPGPAEFAALLRGPVVYMATGAWPTEFSEKTLLEGRVSSTGESIEVAPEGQDPVQLKPFTAIHDESYRCYQPLRQS